MRRDLWLILFACAPAALAADPDGVAILARDLAARSENIAPEYPEFGDLTLCVGRGGYMEWSATVRGGPHFIHFLYCSGEERPCRLSIDGREEAGAILGETTGGFFPAHLAWYTHGPAVLRAGEIRIRIAADGFMPHFRGLYLSQDKEPPSPSVFPPTAAEVADLRGELNVEGLALAIDDLWRRHPDAYPRAAEFAARAAVFREALARAGDDPRALAALREGVEALRAEALGRDNPLLACGKILFVRRYTFQSSHYYTDYIDGCRRFGGNLCILSLASGDVTDLAPSLAGGIFGRFDLSFDGRRAVFAYKARPGEGFRIWEVGVDGTGLRPITFPPGDEEERIARYWQRDSAFLKQREADYRHHTDDLDPCYLPDGGICFISTRCERGILCDPPDVLTTTTLYRMDGDGGAMEVLSQSPVSEASPSVMDDGRILYTRWEYVDKPDVVVKCLWAMRPDGTGSTEIFGNDITFPDTFLHGRAIPGRSDAFAVIGAPHMPLGVGTVIRLDTDHSIRTREPMTYITPDVDVRTEFGFFHRRAGRWVRDTRGPLYTDVFPLDDTFFLVSANVDREWNDVSAYGLHLIDAFGNRVLIHRDAEMSCWQPVPLRPRERPPIVAAAARRGSEPGGAATILMQDVYAGLPGVPRGTIRHLRILETVARPWAARRFWDGDTAYQQHAVVSMNTHLHVKRLIGIVPVAPDGSAHFRVPPDTNLFFQALDGEYMEVQRMRTFINLRPGETRSCIGCHDPQRRVPANARIFAASSPPADPAPQPGETAPRPIHYPSDVQPILDRHCVHCHGAKDPAGDLDLSGELTALFNRSYESILGRELVCVIRENDPKTGEAAPIPPYTLGSHRSRLIEILRAGHEDVVLPREAFIGLVTWVDANAPYYGTYFGRRHIRYRGLPDFRPVPAAD